MNAFTCESVARAALGTPLHTRADELVYNCAHPERHRNGDAYTGLYINIHKKDVFVRGPCGASGKHGSSRLLSRASTGRHVKHH